MLDDDDNDSEDVNIGSTGVLVLGIKAELVGEKEVSLCFILTSPRKLGSCNTCKKHRS